MIACRSVVMQQQLPSNESTQGFMDSEYLLGLGTWATCQNGLSTTLLQFSWKQSKWGSSSGSSKHGLLSLCPSLETVSKPKVLMGAWKCVHSNWKPSRQRFVCIIISWPFLFSFQLPSTNEIGVRKKLWDMGHMWQGSSTYLIMSHVLHHHHHLGGLERQVNPMYLAFYIAQYKNLLPYCQLSLSLTSWKQMLCTRSLNYSIIITHFVWETLLATFPFPTYLTIPPYPYYLSIVVVVAPGTTCHMAPFQQFTCLPTTSYIPSWRCLAIDSKHPIMSLGWKMSLEMSL